MKISLIICTYKRPQAVCDLLRSVEKQEILPFEVLVIDGSPDTSTQNAVSTRHFKLNLHYVKVSAEERGLTRQRNVGITQVNPLCEIIAFLDDDIELTPGYFKHILETYQSYPEAVGVGGLDIKANDWQPLDEVEHYSSFSTYTFDGWVMQEPARYKIRKAFGLLSRLPPGKIPLFSHGRSTLPPSGNTYEVEHFMGGIASYKKILFQKIVFSNYFEGYGLYEDMDFTVRASRLGKLYINTAAQVLHHHDPGGRPNQFKYGQMVVRNGWYVWRLKHSSPGFINVFKWHVITVLLAHLRLANVLTNRKQRMEALTEWAGRMSAWVKLWFSKPKSATFVFLSLCLQIYKSTL